jgi:hypothetical protein
MVLTLTLTDFLFPGEGIFTFPANLKIFAVGLAGRATGKEEDVAGGSFSWGEKARLRASFKPKFRPPKRTKGA